MAIRDLAVGFDGEGPSLAALQFALQMASKYEAAVTGLYVLPDEPKSSRRIDRWLSDDVKAQLAKADSAEQGDVQAAFFAAAKGHPRAEHVQWYSEKGAPNVLMPRLSRYHDLLVVGEFTDPEQTGKSTLSAGELVARAGKPIIVVPEAWQPKPFAEHAVVAWDGSRQASRALTDAMQILETKKALDVITVDVGDGWSKDIGTQGRDLIGHLQRHGINAQQVELAASGAAQVGAAILEYCDEKQPDVLVAGAFGRNKIGSRIFGSVSKELLSNMRLPMMMSG